MQGSITISQHAGVPTFAGWRPQQADTQTAAQNCKIEQTHPCSTHPSYVCVFPPATDHASSSEDVASTWGLGRISSTKQTKRMATKHAQAMSLTCFGACDFVQHAPAVWAMARRRRESPVRGLPDPAQQVSGQGSAYLLEVPWYRKLESDSVNSKLRTWLDLRPFPEKHQGSVDRGPDELGELTSLETQNPKSETSPITPKRSGVWLRACRCRRDLQTRRHSCPAGCNNLLGRVS